MLKFRHKLLLKTRGYDFRSKPKQPSLRGGQGFHGVVQAQVLSGIQRFRNVFFRPEEYGLASIIADDVAAAEGTPIDSGDEQDWIGAGLAGAPS